MTENLPPTPKSLEKLELELRDAIKERDSELVKELRAELATLKAEIAALRDGKTDSANDDEDDDFIFG